MPSRFTHPRASHVCRRQRSLTASFGEANVLTTMLVADDLAASPHSTIRPSRLTAPSNNSSCSTDHRENRAASGSRIWNTARLPLENIGRPERWGFGDWDRDSSASHGDAHDSRFNVGGNRDAHDHDDLVRMSTWAGQPGVKGRSETVRMVLLTCVSIGITSVHTCALRCPGAYSS